MSLSEIKEKLYRKDAPDDLSKHGTSEYDPKTAEKSESPTPSQEDLWKEKEEGLDKTEKKALKRGLIIFGIVIFIALSSVIFYEVRRWMFSEGSASIFIDGPDQAKSGKLLTYEITYKNGNWVDINNAEIKISYPENLKPDENPNYKEETPTSGRYFIGTVKSHSESKVVFNAKAYSPKGALIYLKADLAYQPTGFSNRFEVKSQMGINVISAPITLEIQAPQNVSSGDAIDYLVSYRNDGTETISSFRIKMEYPDQFTFSSSNPKTSESNNIWYIGSLNPGQSEKIVVSGKLEGERDKIKSVKAIAGTTQDGEFIVFNEEIADTKIVSSAFSIAQTVNGLESLNANAGDTLQFKIMYKNNSDIGLRDVIVTEKIESPVLDYATLNMPGGNFDQSNKTITWKASDTKNLKNLGPGEGGSISFSIKVKEIIPVSSANDKNFVISSLARIDSPDVPTPISMNKIISSNVMDIRLNSKLVLDVKGYYNDSQIPNSGPVPPKVDQETTYTIHWKITNVSNDITGAKVSAVLPTNAKMTGKVYPEDARITYNERDNSIFWDAGNVSAGTGVLNAPLEASFQVLVKPFLSQAGREVGLLGESTLTASDSFTGENLEKKENSKNSNLIEDGSLTGEGRVAAE